MDKLIYLEISPTSGEILFNNEKKVADVQMFEDGYFVASVEKGWLNPWVFKEISRIVNKLNEPIEKSLRDYNDK